MGGGRDCFTGSEVASSRPFSGPSLCSTLQGTMVQISPNNPDIMMPTSDYLVLMEKGTNGTKEIRLLMKHFFSRETLANSSLTGEGLYPNKLDENIISAIRGESVLWHKRNRWRRGNSNLFIRLISLGCQLILSQSHFVLFISVIEKLFTND